LYNLEFWKKVSKTLLSLSLYQELDTVLTNLNKKIYLNDINNGNDNNFDIYNVISCYGSSKIASRLIKNYIDLNYMMKYQKEYYSETIL
jgi:hypothetical protein